MDDLVNDFERGYVRLSRIALFTLFACVVYQSCVEAGLVKGLDWLAATKTKVLSASVLTENSSRSNDPTGSSFTTPLGSSSYNFHSDSSLPPELPVQPHRYTGTPAAGTPASMPPGWANQEDFID